MYWKNKRPGNRVDYPAFRYLKAFMADLKDLFR